MLYENINQAKTLVELAFIVVPVVYLLIQALKIRKSLKGV